MLNWGQDPVIAPVGMRRILAVALVGLLTVMIETRCVAGAPGGKGGKMENDSSRVVRKAHGSGRWFPGSAKQLKTMVDGFLADAQPPSVTGRIVAAISPHAGYVYSGKVAGYTFRAIRDQARAGGAPDVVVVLGFSHRSGFGGVALMDGHALETPLGEVSLDYGAASVLTGCSENIRFQYEPHVGEHSAENQIPFVQTALPGVPLVVGLIGDHDPKTLADLVGALGELSARRKTLVIASTDLLHDADYGLVSRTDRETLKTIESMNFDSLAKGWGYQRQTCCGIGPVLTVMRHARKMGSRRGVVLCYRNSGDDFPESRGQWVVGYGAVVFGVEHSDSASGGDK